MRNITYIENLPIPLHPTNQPTNQPPHFRLVGCLCKDASGWLVGSHPVLLASVDECEPLGSQSKMTNPFEKALPRPQIELWSSVAVSPHSPLL